MPGIREAQTEEEVRAFDLEVRSILGPAPIPEYTIEPRVCGVEVSLFYEKGVLARATTRSDPQEAIDVTPNIRTILTVPLELSTIKGVKKPPDRMEVWGIAYLESRDAVREKPCSAREDVAASLVRADLKETARRPYNLFCYGVEREPEVGACFGVETHYEIMLELQNLGLRINRPHIRHCLDLSAVIENICAVKEQRNELPYGVDGAVIQVNPLAQRRALEEKGAEPVFMLGFECSGSTRA